MKLWLTAMSMCQSMFCALPCPWHVWDENARERMLLCLPGLGVEIGLLWYFSACVVRFLSVPVLLRAAVICLAPWILTGFIHLDGFMDVTDAVRSWRSPERRREILKDSHVGSFAVIAFGAVLLLGFSAAASLPKDTDLRLLVLVPCVSRSCSVLAIQRLRPMASSQYASCRQPQFWTLVPLLFLIGALLIGYLLRPINVMILSGEMGTFALFLRRAYRSLEGMNGDISGYCITLAETAALLLASCLL